jgi:mxaJ protein
MGYPSHADPVLTTRPYYRSTYVFVTRRASRLDIRSFDAPQLRRLRIGVQLVGDDGANSPPAHALSRRGIIDNVRGYTVYGDYLHADPQRAIIDAVARGEIDAAVVWGPLAFFAARETEALAIEPVTPQRDGRAVPFVYDISMGVRRGDTALRDALNRTIAGRRAEIGRILRAFHVPLVEPARTAAATWPPRRRAAGGQP